MKAARSFDRQLQPGCTGLADGEQGTVLGFEEGGYAAEIARRFPRGEGRGPVAADEEVSAGTAEYDRARFQLYPGHDEHGDGQLPPGPVRAVIGRDKRMAAQTVDEQRVIAQGQRAEERAFIGDDAFCPGLAG